MGKMECRYCKTDLDDGDILDVLARLESYKTKTPEQLERIAATYGWTRTTPRRFSRECTFQFPGDMPQIKICPDCRGVWPLSTTKPRRWYFV